MEEGTEAMTATGPDLAAALPAVVSPCEPDGRRRPGEPPWFLHMHAVERMRTMGVTRADVLAVLNDPEVTWTASLHDGRRGLDRRMYVRGGLAVVTAGRKVLTVLLHTREGTPWTR